MIVTDLSTPRRKGPKIVEQSPAAKSELTQSLMTLKPPTIVEEVCSSSHQAVYQIAGAVTSGMVIAECITVRHRKPYCQPIAASAQQLSDLIHRRQQLVDIQVAEKNRLARASTIVQADIEDHLNQLEQRIEIHRTPCGGKLGGR